MTRQELEQLCQPLSPEDTVIELENICDEKVKEQGIDTEAIALRASFDILNKLIEAFDESPSVRAARMVF